MPEIRLEDTIAAVSTPIGEGGISVIRISGPGAFDLAARIFHPAQKEDVRSYSSHTIHLGEVRDEGKTLDKVLVSAFRSPHSYTGENVIEISGHGGLAVTRRVLDLLVQKGARHADPGEFTKRAFLNGKIDLAQAEAVLDLIKAKSDRALETAVSHLTGSLSRSFKALKEELMYLYAHMEAFLDFPDEHLEVYSDKEFSNRLGMVREKIENLIASFRRGSLIREGLVVVIVGKPNVGKSSLFNALLARDRALVSEFPGTTRDRLEEAITIDGFLIRLVDTAGLIPDAGHPLDRMGVENTRRIFTEAQIFLYVTDGSEPLTKEDRLAYQEIEKDKVVIPLVNKSDLPVKMDLAEFSHMSGAYVSISTTTREGLEELEKKIGESIRQRCPENESEQITRLRHKNTLESALEALRRAQKAFSAEEPLELVIEDLKDALDGLRELIGEIYSEDLLDVIFSEFCIGK